MMLRTSIGLGLVGWLGLIMVFSEFSWFRKRHLTDRLAPFVSGGATASARRQPILSGASFREVTGPLAQTLGDYLAALFGIQTDLESRLQRIHSRETSVDFRIRQAAWSAGGALLAAFAALVVGAGPIVALLLVAGIPLLTFLVIEQRLLSAAQSWQQQVEAELPVVAEQLAMLLGAGYSMTAAISRLAHRGSGACSDDFARVHRRVGQGIGVEAALREWAAVVDVEPVRRLVGVLELNRDAGDIGRLISDEARTIRREAQRRQIERIERRNQQVWIPVTVATLVPGVILLAVPFIDALSAFSGS